MFPLSIALRLFTSALPVGVTTTYGRTTVHLSPVPWSVKLVVGAVPTNQRNQKSYKTGLFPHYSQLLTISGLNLGLGFGTLEGDQSRSPGRELRYKGGCWGLEHGAPMIRMGAGVWWGKEQENTMGRRCIPWEGSKGVHMGAANLLTGSQAPHAISHWVGAGPGPGSLTVLSP